MKMQVDKGIVVLGKRGSGKTVLIRYLINQFSPNYHIHVFDVVGNLKEFKNYPNVDYYLVNPHDVERVEELFKAIYDARKPCMIVIDEGDRYAYGFLKRTYLNDLINLGRNYGIGYIVSARTSAELHKDFMKNSSANFVFRHTHPRDLMVLTNWLDVDEETLRTLPPHVFLFFYDDVLLFKGMVEIEK